MEKGFTLVELLITVSILAVITTLTLVNYNGSNAKARDAQRKSDFRAIRTALEQYKLDTGSYPLAGTTTFPAQSVQIQAATPSPGVGETQFTALMSTLVSGYLPRAFSDPRNTTIYRYRYTVNDSGAGSFTLETCLETATDPQRYQNSSGTFTVLNPCTATAPNYRVFNP
jgi:prepilin-type N-terminal cleavage/methylation domain-containing protein